MYDTRLHEYFICGGFGGICAIIVGHPFDTIKVRLQTMPMPNPGETALYSGPWNCFKKSVTNEGFRSLFKGMGLPIFTVAPIWALSFLTYGIGKQIFGPSDGRRLTPLQLFASGSFSGLFTSCILAPGERIKCLLQIQRYSNTTANAYRGPLDCAKRIYRQGGFSAIYRGIGLTLIREVPGSGIYFLTYETLKEREVVDSELWKNLRIIIAGGTAGVAYWIAGMPTDIIKSRLQTAPEDGPKTTITQIFKQLLKQEGALGFYKGITPVMIRAFVANAACFLGYDFCKRKFFLSKTNLTPEGNMQPLAQKPNKS